MMVEDLKRQAFGGTDKSVGVFDCKNVTIVNGAQTVGTIGRAVEGDESAAFLQARIIVVDDLESTHGKRITRASNTQNKIDARNFVALDPEQERIRTELLLEKVNYEFREGEPLDSTVDGFEFIEAITALACATDDISYLAARRPHHVRHVFHRRPHHRHFDEPNPRPRKALARSRRTFRPAL